jgi:hypothetical protein
MRLSAKAALDLVKQTARAWSEDYAPSMGAALWYYTRRCFSSSLPWPFVAGLALGAAKWLATDHWHDLKRRLT